MAKKPYRKRRFNLRRVRFDAQIALATTANQVVVTSGLTGTSANPYRCKSVKVTWNLKNLTPGQGPILFGYAHSDYSVGEIKECLEVGTSIDRGDKVALEQANRLVRLVGSFDGLLSEEKFNEGRPMKTKLNWAIGIGDEVSMFIYNDSGGAFTTGAFCDVLGEMWVQD